MKLWTFEALPEPDGWRWLFSEGGSPRSVSAALYATRREALSAAARFSELADHLAWYVAPEDAAYWYWLVRAPNGVVCCSGPYRGIESAQEAGERARMAVPHAMPRI